MILTLITIAGGVSIVYHTLCGKVNKITSKGRLVKNVLKTFLLVASVLVGGYFGINLLIGG